MEITKQLQNNYKTTTKQLHAVLVKTKDAKDAHTGLIYE